MAETGNVKCKSCGCEISIEESYVLDGFTVCEDCYLEKSHQVIACNPLATYSAKRFQESDGLEAEERLNEQQKAIYRFVKSRGKVTPQELVDQFNLSRFEVENQIAVLRHLELTKRKKEDNKTYVVPF